MLHGYCVRRSRDPGPEAGLTGVGGAAVRLLDAGSLGLWISEGEAAPPTVARLAEHDRVVRRALRTATPLPIRYGAGQFASESAAREALLARADEFAASLRRLEGRVEMGVRVDWDPPSPAAPPPDQTPGPEGGRAYLEARRTAILAEDAVRAAAGEALDRVEREIGLDGVPTARTVLPQQTTAGILAHLVRRADVESYARAVAAARERLGDLRITHSGPWAPYSFS